MALLTSLATTLEQCGANNRVNWPLPHLFHQHGDVQYGDHDLDGDHDDQDENSYGDQINVMTTLKWDPSLNTDLYRTFMMVVKIMVVVSVVFWQQEVKHLKFSKFVAYLLAFWES